MVKSMLRKVSKRKVRISKVAYRGHVPLEDMTEVLRSAGYVVSEPGG